MLRVHIAFQILSWNRGDLEKLVIDPEVDDSLRPHLEYCQKAYENFIWVLTELKKKYKFGKPFSTEYEKPQKNFLSS